MPSTAITSPDKGSEWHQWDLHFHTTASYDYLNKGVSPEQIVQGLIEKGIRVVAITDHHRIDVQLIRRLQELGGEKLTVLPGIEFCSELGGSRSVHFIGIFPETAELEVIWTKLSGPLNITELEVAQRGDQNIYCPFVQTSKLVRELGGIITVHAGKKSNTIEGLKSEEYIKQVIKKDLVRDWIDIYEVGAISDTAVYVEKVFPHLDRPIPLILCSDNHDILHYERKAPLWLRANPTFRGLLMILQEPIDRVFIGEHPPDVLRVKQNKTKYIRSISFERKATASVGEKWFQGEVFFNSGLVAIIGNKGSGKSALADSLGLLGASKNSDGFSFLSTHRFRHPKGGRAQHFGAKLEWESGETNSIALSDSSPEGSVERIKYLPQDHVEKVCNELIELGGTGFERELKSVIFSHVPTTKRLDQLSLDDLVRFQTDEKQKRIDALLKQLRDLSRSRSRLEAQLDPVVRRALEEKLQARLIEVDAHDKAKPAEVVNPSTTPAGAPQDPKLQKDIGDTEASLVSLGEQIKAAEKDLQALERRQAVAKRLAERIGNFKKEFDVFLPSLDEDALELKLNVPDLVTFTSNSVPIDLIRSKAVTDIAVLRKLLDESDPASLTKRLLDGQSVLKELHAKLDAPNLAFQTYLKQLELWTSKRVKLIGDKSDAESAEGLQAAISALDGLPMEIAVVATGQVKLALEIHSVKLTQVEVYRTLYGPVQDFIGSHPLAKDKLRLEFRAELVSQGFTEKLLALLSQNKRGSFMGVEDGKRKLASLLQVVSWDDPESVSAFLNAIDTSLHNDQRSEPVTVTLLSDQLAKGSTAEEVFDILYGLDYVKPRYVLRWDGKELEMLSPGERGTLLLVFYLLIDQSDLPLVIDQPEGNLDNHTVAKVLVDCIREARKRRQVFIVTHNPNLAVVCDADQVVHAHIDKMDGNAITYTSGALEDKAMSHLVTDVLEGTRWAFGVRGDKYDIGV